MPGPVAANEIDMETGNYRITDIRKATLNGRAVKLFRAYARRAEDGAYIFCGDFSAPRRTADADLARFIDQEGR